MGKIQQAVDDGEGGSQLQQEHYLQMVGFCSTFVWLLGHDVREPAPRATVADDMAASSSKLTEWSQLLRHVNMRAMPVPNLAKMFSRTSIPDAFKVLMQWVLRVFAFDVSLSADRKALRVVVHPCRKQISQNLVSRVKPIIMDVPLNRQQKIHYLFGTRVALTGRFCSPEVQLTVELPGYKSMVRFTVVDEHQVLLIARRITQDCLSHETELINFCKLSVHDMAKKKHADS